MNIAISTVLGLATILAANNFSSVDNREDLRTKLDLTNSRIELSAEHHETEINSALSGQSFGLLDALQVETGEHLNVYEMSVDKLVAANSNVTVKQRFEDNRIIVRDLRGYDSNGESQANDEDLYKRSVELLKSFGGNKSEETQYDVRYLMVSRKIRPEPLSSNQDMQIQDIPPEKLAKKVFIQRNIGNIPVVGDKLVFSYTLDGKFRKMLGKWHHIDYENSKMSSSISEDLFVEKALDNLQENDVNASTTEYIRLRTIFSLKKTQSGNHAVDLVGCAIVGVRGPMESVTEVWYNFDINP